MVCPPHVTSCGDRVKSPSWVTEEPINVVQPDSGFSARFHVDGLGETTSLWNNLPSAPDPSNERHRNNSVVRSGRSTPGICERTLCVSRDKYLPSRNRGLQVPREPTTIGSHLRRRRLQLKIFQSEAARRLEVSIVSLSHWEWDKVFPTAPHHPQIVEYLGYNPFKNGTK